MIGSRAGTQIWLACGVTDMRRGMDSLAAQVQQILQTSPFDGHVFVFRGRRGDLVKLLWWDDGMCLFIKRLEQGRFVWPQATQGALHLTQAQLSMLLEGIDWVRRETVKREKVKVLYDEEVAIHIDPEPCGGVRENVTEALTGAHVGQPLSNERLPNWSADAFQSAEGNTSCCDSASNRWLHVVCRPWHACTSLEREPRDLRAAHASRAVGRMVKAGSQRP
jgi:transposase